MEMRNCRAFLAFTILSCCRRDSDLYRRLGQVTVMALMALPRSPVVTMTRLYRSRLTRITLSRMASSSGNTLPNATEYTVRHFLRGSPRSSVLSFKVSHLLHYVGPSPVGLPSCLDVLPETHTPFPLSYLGINTCGQQHAELHYHGPIAPRLLVPAFVTRSTRGQTTTLQRQYRQNYNPPHQRRGLSHNPAARFHLTQTRIQKTLKHLMTY